ncbi:hypothetical protein M422DRAFT_252897 [Sphaerobolus stellatus SS14]|uniref:Uncharacterized protein n=1 Tax=Sphaerobolus stellatus (strain SS14) TaxID=990650 RepID=A0A0C9VYS5_SPHS4|nr:hypothetical protein M422DRAFT_252897 [Sphaerobolus stellatus SS14]
MAVGEEELHIWVHIALHCKAPHDLELSSCSSCACIFQLQRIRRVLRSVSASERAPTPHSHLRCDSHSCPGSPAAKMRSPASASASDTAPLMLSSIFADGACVCTFDTLDTLDAHESYVADEDMSNREDVEPERKSIEESESMVFLHVGGWMGFMGHGGTMKMVAEEEEVEMEEEAEGPPVKQGEMLSFERPSMTN